MKIQFDGSGESQSFVATRDIRNSEYNRGTISEGESVFFRKADSGITLLYSDGAPTNGNQYVTFATVKDANAFVKSTKLEPE